MSIMQKNAVAFRGAVRVRADAGADVSAALRNIQTLGEAFEEFKATHSEVAKQEAKGAVDALLTEKMERLNAQLTESQGAVSSLAERVEHLSRNQRPTGLGGREMTEDEQEHSRAFESYFRNGDETGFRALQSRLPTQRINAAISVGSDPDGGYTAPVEWDRTVTDGLVIISQMRQLATVQSVTGQGFSKLYNLKGTTSGWVGETDDRPETNTPQLAPYAFSFGELYANPRMTQYSLEDPELDLAAWLAGEVDEEFSLKEGQAFIDGNGVNKPKGILEYDAAKETALAANLRHPLGPIAEFNTGAAGAITADGLIMLTYQLHSMRRQGASFYLNKNTLGAVRLLKDGDGTYLWQPSYVSGQPGTIAGYAANELDGLPDVAAGEIPILFGNMQRTYRIFDRVGVSVLRDPYTAKPYVHFYTRKRVGGGMWNPEWMVYHRVGA